jgi:predicted hydrocarbon binding protein
MMDHAMPVTAARKLLEGAYAHSGIRNTAPGRQVALTHSVPANTLRMVLESVARVSGPHYELVLGDSGLERFTATPPPASLEPVATAEELTRLYAAVHERLGEPLTRLFLRNYGRLLPEKMLQTRWGQAIQAQAPQVPSDRRLEWFLRELARMTAQYGTRLTVTEDDWAWYIALEQCPSCAGIHDVSAPICADGEVNYKGMAEKVVGRRIRVIEVECAAMGARHCKYAFFK